MHFYTTVIVLYQKLYIVKNQLKIRQTNSNTNKAIINQNKNKINSKQYKKCY